MQGQRLRREVPVPQVRGVLFFARALPLCAQLFCNPYPIGYNWGIMLQIQVFGLDKSEDANAFIKTVRLIENGVQVREDCIVILYDNANSFDAKSREVALVSKLAQAEGALLATEIEDEYYTLIEQGGKVTSEVLASKQKNLENKSGLEAQIFILKKKLGRDPGTPVLFGKKQYEKTKK